MPFDQEMSGKARTGHAIGVANRNRPARDVVFLRINAKPVAAIENLAGKGFVKFPKLYVTVPFLGKLRLLLCWMSRIRLQ